MKWPTILAVCAASVTASVLPRASSSKSWAGTSSYFLQGMEGTVQDSYLQQLANDGAKVVRVWVNTLSINSCQKGQKMGYDVPDLEGGGFGQWNDEALHYLDFTLTKLAAHGLKALVSLHDANVLQKGSPNGFDVYGRTYGSDGFYTNSQAAANFDNRVNHILTYKGKHSGQVWSNYHDVIMGFDIQNEPYQYSNGLCSAGTNSFLCDRANKMRNILGGQNPIKIITGGIGGDSVHGCTFMASAARCPTIDIISAHRYGGDDDSFKSVAANYASQAKSNNKLLIIEEFGVQQGYSHGFNTQGDDITSAGVPWIYWEVVPAPVSGCGNGDDGYTQYYGSGNFNAKSAFGNAANKDAAQNWSGIVY